MKKNLDFDYFIYAVCILLVNSNIIKKQKKIIVGLKMCHECFFRVF